MCWIKCCFISSAGGGHVVKLDETTSQRSLQCFPSSRSSISVWLLKSRFILFSILSYCHVTAHYIRQQTNKQTSFSAKKKRKDARTLQLENEPKVQVRHRTLNTLNFPAANIDLRRRLRFIYFTDLFTPGLSQSQSPNDQLLLAFRDSYIMCIYSATVGEIDCRESCPHAYGWLTCVSDSVAASAPPANSD